MNIDSRIYVTHHRDLVGASIAAALRRHGYSNVILREDDGLDLCDSAAVNDFFEESKPEYVFCFAGPHGGIIKNTTYPSDLIYANLRIQCNVIHSAYLSGVKKLLFMVGGCVYPKDCPQPILEEYYMTGPMEPTSVAYSTARVAGIEMCNAYNKQHGTSFVPAVIANYYGPGDDYSDDGHVLASVMRKMCVAKKSGDKKLALWGTGMPKRQFMYSDDIAEAAILIMDKYESTELINIAGGTELSIAQLARELQKITGYNGDISFDASKPDGAMRKQLDGKKLEALGFKETVTSQEGFSRLFADFNKRA